MNESRVMLASPVLLNPKNTNKQVLVTVGPLLGLGPEAIFPGLVDK